MEGGVGGTEKDMEENLYKPNPVRNLHPCRPIPQKHREKGTTFILTLELSRTKQGVAHGVLFHKSRC